MLQSDFPILSNEQLHGDYWRLRLDAPAFAATASPGQFVQVQIPQLEGHLLRRPFSICDVVDNCLTIVYKVVGTGTAALTRATPGTRLNLLGPLGHGFTPIPADRPAFLLGGGYGCAAMLFTARRAAQAGHAPVILLGARSAADLLLEEEFERLGCEVRLSTDDGSRGLQGRITALLEPELQRHPGAWLAACGPRPMLFALARLAAQFPKCTCEVSLDANMCCGVGACFGCVIQCKAATPQGWEYRRSCADGPVFRAEELHLPG